MQSGISASLQLISKLDFLLPSLRERGWGRGFSILLIGFVCFCSTLAAQTERIEIPITLHDGLGKGIAEYAMNGLSFIDDWDTYIWKDIIPEPKGIPEEWTQTRFGVEFLNQPQFIYQHTQAGQIPEGYMQNSWLENAEFTEKPIRCYLFFAEGIDPEGNRRFVIDGNNNQDLSDDLFFYTDSMTFEKGRKEVRIVYDAYLKGEVIPQERTIYLGYNPHHQMYFGKIAEYATCNLEGMEYILSPYGHNYMAFENFEMIASADMINDKSEFVRKGEYIKRGSFFYCFRAVNLNKQVVIVEKDNRTQSEIEALQVGFHVPGFLGNEITAKNTISLNAYKGKKLLLMVFSPGCGSCMDKIPVMNELYEVNDSIINIMGIALYTIEGDLTVFKNEHQIHWPLVIADSAEFGKYATLSLPTFFLINQDGVIIKKTSNLDEVKEELGKR